MNLTTFQISQCIVKKDYATAELAITDFIRSNTHANDVLDIPVKSMPLDATRVDQEQVHYTFCEQFVTLITQLFSAPGYKPSKTTIHTFFTCKFVIEWLFNASLWKNTDALIEHLQLIQTDRLGNLKLNEKRLTLLLMLITLSSKSKLPWKVLFKAMPAQALSSYIGLITQPIPALTKESNAGFNYSLESAKDLPMFDLPVVEDLGKLNYPFFACSYATSPEKYEFKKWLTKLIRHNLSQWLSPTLKLNIDDIQGLQQKPKLKMAVMLELYSTNHAMYRCYNGRLKNLAKDYELIAFIDEDKVNDEMLSFFDKAIGFKNVFDINKNVELVLQEKPDLIFYPSIGMNFWGIYLSQLRLAPIQVMMGGHPSSSYSPVIDYCLLPGDSFTSEDIQPFFSEKIIMTDEHSRNTIVHTIHSELDQSFIKEHNQFLENDDEIRIAINGVMTKVTYPVVDICRQIELKTKKKITFVFFSGNDKNSLAYLATKKQLSRVLKQFELASFADYKTYMETISQCHLLLPTLPFGGANSNIDAMILNKPKLFIKGKEQLYTRTDTINWDRVGLVDELGSNTVDALINKVVLLIGNKELREQLHSIISAKCAIDKICHDDKEYSHSINKHFKEAIKHFIQE